MSLLPPGRFLMPGNLAGSPALTFAPLDLPADGAAPEGSLWAMMVRRYEAYKDVVVRPFFRDHFARLDRQIVLVDALAAFNCRAGSAARPRGGAGGNSRLFQDRPQHVCQLSLFRPRIDRILFAATKADHLHHSSHDRLEAILRRTVARAATRAEYSRRRASTWSRWPPCAPPARPGRSAAATNCRRSSARPPTARWQMARAFDGTTEVATFPGDLPADARRAVRRRGGRSAPSGRATAPPTRPIFASCASVRRCWRCEGAEPRRCPISASTARSSS